MEKINIKDLKNILDNEEFIDLIIHMIMDLEKKYYKIIMLSYKSRELFNKTTKLKNKTKKIKEKIKLLDNILLENNIKFNNFYFSKNKIIELDYKFKTNTYELFIELKYESDINKKLAILNKLRENYLNISNNLSSVHYKDECEKYKIKALIKQILKYINNEYRNLKNTIKQPVKNSEKSLPKKEKEKKKIIENNHLLNLILEGKGTSMYSLDEVLLYLKKCINQNKINSNLIECALDLVSRMDKEEYNVTNLYAILDRIKYKKIDLDKSSKEYNILNEIKKILKEYIKEDKYNIDNKMLSSKYDIIDCLLDDENNYPLLKKIIINYPEFINSRKNEKHIANHILDLYLYNLELLLTKQNQNILNVEYLKEIYSLFTKSGYIKMTKEDTSLINQKIYEFISRLTNDETIKQIILNDKEFDAIYVKKDKKRKKLIEDTKKLSTHYYFMKNLNNKNVDESKLYNQLNFIFNSDDKDKLREKEVDNTNDKNIILPNNDFISYSFDQRENRNVIKLSMKDLTNILPMDTTVSNYIYNSTIFNNKIDNRLEDRLKIKEGSKQSVITFEFLLENNNIIDFKIYKSKIVSEKVQDSNIDIYNNILDTVKSLSCEKEKNSNNEDMIYNFMKRIINHEYLKICNEKGLPFIYSGVEKINNIDSNTYSDIAFILRKLDKKETKNIYNIIVDNLGEFHYSDVPFEVVDDFDMNLIGGINYMIMLNQIIIKTLLINELDLCEEELDRKRKELNREHNDLLLDLNESLKHKDVEDFDIKTKRQRSKEIIYTTIK